MLQIPKYAAKAMIMDTLGGRMQVSPGIRKRRRVSGGLALDCRPHFSEIEWGTSSHSLLHHNATQNFLGEPHEQHASTLCAVARIQSLLLQPTGHFL